MSVKKAIIILIVIAVIGSAAVFVMTRDKANVTYTTAKVEKGSIIQTVSETGTVKANQEINLSFLNSGRIARIYAAVGSQVAVGTVLAELDYTSLKINLNEAKANVDVARENLNKLLGGAEAEEVAVTRSSVTQAQGSYDAAKKELIKGKASAEENIKQAQRTLNDLELNTINDITTYEQSIATARTNLTNTKSTYQKTIDDYKEAGLATAYDKLTKANTALDTINRVITDEDGEGLIGVQAPTSLTNTTLTYNEAVILLASAQSNVAAARISNINHEVTAAINSAVAVLDKTFTSLKYCYTALENSITSSGFSQADLDALKTSISAEQTLIGTAIAAAQTAKQNLENAILDYNTKVAGAEDNLAAAQAAYDNAVINATNALATAQITGEQQITVAESKMNNTLEAWQVAQAKLKQIQAPANKYDIALNQAKIRQAEAALATANKKIEDSIIKAPLSGIITKVDFEIGEQVSVGLPVVSLLVENNFEIEVLISEADIAKASLNNPAEITFDAFGDDVKFKGLVYFIEPAETVIQDVIYYKVLVSFDPAGQDVKSGMTANVIITTARKDNVLVIPSRAVIIQNGQGKIVRVLLNGELIDKQVTIGLRGDEGRVEVLSGMKPGEAVVTQIKEE